MKQYKLIIKENFSEDLSGILNREARGGWKLNSLDSSRNVKPHARSRQTLVMVFEK